VLNPLNTVDSMELLIDKIKEAQSNAEFLASMNS
jgi:transcription termination factor Rho